MTTPQIVSIVCPGHSGSTLLDMVLGTLPGVASSGEMVYIPWKIFKENHPDNYQTTYCSCGETMKNCLFWRPVLDRCSEKLGFDVLKAPEKFDISINRPPYFGKSKKASVIRHILTEGSRLVNINILISALYRFYAQSVKANWMLFDAIQEATGKKIVVDSTKDIYRHLFLRKHRKNHVKLIVLVRDVYGVVSSSYYDQSEEKIQLGAQGWLKFYNVRLYNVIKHLDKSEYMIIRYEDLAKKLHEMSRMIAAFLDIRKPVPVIERLYPAKMHIVAGNPVRSKPEMEIRYDERWKERLTPEQIEKLSVIQNLLHPLFREYLTY